MKQQGFRTLVHTPAELGLEYLEWAENIQASPGLIFGLPSIDKVVIPIRRGELVFFIARPGHCKTSLLAFFAKQEADRITADKKQEMQAVVYCTWEQSAEELEAFFQADGEYSASDVAWGRVDLDRVRSKAVKRANLPIWIIGHGIGRAGEKTPRMTPNAVIEAVGTMKSDFGIEPRLMLFDYIQIIPTERATDRVQQVTELPILIKELALRLGVPALVGVQASRDVDKRNIKLPEMFDAQWASSIEQTGDKVLSLWRPWQTEQPGQLIEVDGRAIEVTEWLILMRLLKQRGERGRHTWALYFEPHRMKLAEMETRHDNLNFD